MALKFIDLSNDLSGSHNVDFQRESRRKYLAFFGVGDDENYVRSHCGLTVGTRHPTDRQQVLHKIEVNSLGAATWDGDNSLCRLWEIHASYGTWNPAERGDPSQAGNPLALPPRYRFEWEKVPEPVWQDKNNKPILNTAGDPFDPPVERSGLVGILTVRRNEANPNFPALIALSESINLYAWNGFDARTVRFSPPSLPELEYSQESQAYYYPMVYVFEINPRNWRAKVLNAGYRQKSPTQQNQNRVLQITDDSGQPLQSPGLLSGNGSYLKPPVPQNQVLYLEFDLYNEVDFSAFGLNDLFTPPGVLS